MITVRASGSTGSPGPGTKTPRPRPENGASWAGRSALDQADGRPPGAPAILVRTDPVSYTLNIMTDDSDSPGARADAARAGLDAELAALEANLASIAARLKAVREQESAVYAELEEAVVQAEPRLGATRVM